MFNTRGAPPVWVYTFDSERLRDEYYDELCVRYGWQKGEYYADDDVDIDEGGIYIMYRDKGDDCFIDFNTEGYKYERHMGKLPDGTWCRY